MKLSRKSFDQLVEQAIASLPAEFAQWLDEVPVIVEDRPGKSDREGAVEPDEDDPLGMFAGPSLEDTRQGELPPRIMIYRQPLMDACQSRDQLAEEIRKTLIHELGHYAGMDEDQLENKGYGPMEDEDTVDFDLDDDENG